MLCVMFIVDSGGEAETMTIIFTKSPPSAKWPNVINNKQSSLCIVSAGSIFEQGYFSLTPIPTSK